MVHIGYRLSLSHKVAIEIKNNALLFLYIPPHHSFGFSDMGSTDRYDPLVYPFPCNATSYANIGGSGGQYCVFNNPDMFSQIITIFNIILILDYSANVCI